MTAPESSQSERVNLRDVWPNEGYNFTPWLADNLDLLAKAVGIMGLELDQTEAPGWSGFLDILAERTDGAKVAIENQLEASDSDHFARLIGYAAEHDARDLIWVAPQFWEYHLRQVAWLKKAMAGNVEIHAVAVRLLPGGDLRPAGSDETVPGFHAEFSPVDLEKHGPEWAVLRSGELSETAQKYRDFFLQLLGGLRSARFTDTERVRASNDQEFPSGFPGIGYHVGFWDGGRAASVYLWIATWDADFNKRVFDGLKRCRENIDSELGEHRVEPDGRILWNRGDNARISSLIVTRKGSINAPAEQLDEIREWMLKTLLELKDVIQPHLKAVMDELEGDRRVE